MKPPRMTATVAWWSGPRKVRAYRLHRLFAAHRDDLSELWTVTHLPTGHAVRQHILSLSIAVRFTKRLLCEFAARRWNFTDPETVKGWRGAGKRVSAILEKCYEDESPKAK